MRKIDFLSVVIPAYNEAPRIGPTLKEVAAHLARQPYRWEILVVDDGSRDDTAQKVEELMGEIPRLRLARHEMNQGKGAAVQTGMKATRGGTILLCDADAATPFEELDRLLPELSGGTALVTGTRKSAASRVLVAQPWPRRTMSRAYQWICQGVLGLNVSDVTCGFKLLSREAADRIAPRMRIRRWSFDAEMHLIARIQGLTTVEVPIRWADQRQTKVRLLKDAVFSFWELLKIRRYAAQGAYR